MPCKENHKVGKYFKIKWKMPCKANHKVGKCCKIKHMIALCFQGITQGSICNFPDKE